MANEKKGKKNFTPNAKVCGNCFVPDGTDGAPKLSACARCGLVVYCSRDCQRPHWKANHKQHCIAKADRAPQIENPSEADSSAASTEEKCAICQDMLTGSSSTTLPCTHVFHGTCVAELRKFGVEQACPLCRIPLPPGNEKLNEEATRRFVVILHLVECGYATWSALPTSAQHELDAAVSGWRTAAEEGHAMAQLNLTMLYEGGHGVEQDYIKAEHWFKKAGLRGHRFAWVQWLSMAQVLWLRVTRKHSSYTKKPLIKETCLRSVTWGLAFCTATAWTIVTRKRRGGLSWQLTKGMQWRSAIWDSSLRRAAPLQSSLLITRNFNLS